MGVMVIGYLQCTQITPFTRVILSGHSNLYPACLVLILVCSLVTKGAFTLCFCFGTFPFSVEKNVNNGKKDGHVAPIGLANFFKIICKKLNRALVLPPGQIFLGVLKVVSLYLEF